MPTLFNSANMLKLDQVSSTNSYLKDLSQGQLVSEGFWVQTQYQTSGRGQFGNRWEAAAGENLLFSFFLRPTFLKASQGFALNMSVCLAWKDVLQGLHPSFVLKWPNDLLFKNHKVGGILIENTLNGSTLSSSIIGVGLNVNQRQFASAKARSLAEVLGKSIVPDVLALQFQKTFTKRYAELKRQPLSLLTNEYLKSLYGYQQEVLLQEGRHTYKGVVKGVSPEGYLQVHTQDGTQKSYAFKEVSFLL